MKINVISEVREVESYESQQKHLREINLKYTIKDGKYHYELINNNVCGDGNFELRYSKELPLLVYDKKHYFDGKNIIDYNGKLPKNHHIIELSDVQRIFRTKCDFKEAYNLYFNAVINIKKCLLINLKYLNLDI